METIRNYLESMFRGLPLTEKVAKAKSELLQMMEDKYTELIRNGKTENEAVGEVIQNFGNLEDIADDLGISDILHDTKKAGENRRKLSFEEVTEYVAAKRKSVIIRAIGISLFIMCVIFPIFCDAFDLNDALGVALMFLSIGCGVIFMCLSHSLMEQWHFIKSEPCSIDPVATDYLKNKNRDFLPAYSICSSIGILLCILSFIPAVVMNELDGHIMDEIGGALLFVFVGVGVALIVYANSIKKNYSRLLGLNTQNVFIEEKDDLENIKNPTARVFMSVYWSVITCIYLCVSFITFKWHMTWLIWPIAAVIYTILKETLANRNSEER